MNDTISRQAAIKAIDDLPNCYNGYSDTYDKAYIIGVLEELPSAQPERKRGEWIMKDDEKMWWYECSVCGEKPLMSVYVQDVLSDFCPHCGADMKGEE